jgi:hypothetical protein
VQMRDTRFVGNGELKRSHSAYAADGLSDTRRRTRLQRAWSDSSPFLSFEPCFSVFRARRACTDDDVLRAGRTNDEGI